MSTNTLVDRLKRYPLAVICAVVLLVCLVLMFLRGSVVSELEGVEAELNARIHTIEQNSVNSKGLEAQVNTLESEVSDLDSRLFDPSEVGINTKFFYSFEKLEDVLITGVSQLPVDDAVLTAGGPHELNLYSALVYEVSLEGSFAQLLSFMHSLHTVDPLIRVADFQISSVKKSKSDEETLAAKLRVLVLAYKK